MGIVEGTILFIFIAVILGTVLTFHGGIDEIEVDVVLYFGVEFSEVLDETVGISIIYVRLDCYCLEDRN